MGKKKSKLIENKHKKAILGGASIGSTASFAIETAKEYRATKEVSKIKGSRGFKDFVKKLKVGDVILEADPKRIYTDPLIPEATRFGKRFKSSKVVKFSDVIALSGGGKTSHVAIYAGKGKVRAFPTGNLEKYEFQAGKRYYAKRFAKTPKQGISIAAASRKIVEKEGKYYKFFGDVIKDALRRNIADVPRTALKKFVDCGTTTCSSFAAESIERGTKIKAVRGVREGLVDPTDLFQSKRGKFVAKLNANIKKSASERIFGILGKQVRTLKLGLLGAVVGSGAYLAKKHLTKKKIVRKKSVKKNNKNVIFRRVKGRIIPIARGK